MNFTFNQKKMDELLDSFYDLTNIRYVFFDTKHKIICSSGQQTEFCDVLVHNKAFNDRCIESDAQNMIAASKRDERSGLYIYRCHCGIINVIFPITDGNQVFGYMMFGQLLDETDINKQWEGTRDSLGNLNGINETKLKEAFFKLPQLTMKKITSVSNLLRACTTYIRIEGITRQMNMTDEEKLEFIIQQRYQENLTLDSIASEMHISKSKLCSIAAKKDTTITKMINDYRMRIAAYALMGTHKKISEIAAEVGMLDYNYFTKVFKSVYGVTPRDYRVRVVNIQDEI